jgi:Fe2+ transport system protein FeoA
MSVSELKPGQRGKVTQVNARGAIRQRLLDMGVLPDMVVELERVAPTGDPLWIKLEGSQLALRQSEAEAVRVDVLSDVAV